MDEKIGEWQLDLGYASTGKFERFNKKHGREFDSLFINLNKILGVLKSGHKIGSFQIGFFRSEGDGLYRIGQTSVRSAKESRLYVYPDQQTQTMYILSIGVKESQSQDINDAKASIKVIRKQRDESKQGSECG
jgi:hypothetical protein